MTIRALSKIQDDQYWEVRFDNKRFDITLVDKPDFICSIYQVLNFAHLLTVAHTILFNKDELNKRLQEEGLGEKEVTEARQNLYDRSVSLMQTQTPFIWVINSFFLWLFGYTKEHSLEALATTLDPFYDEKLKLLVDRTSLLVKDKAVLKNVSVNPFLKKDILVLQFLVDQFTEKMEAEEFNWDNVQAKDSYDSILRLADRISKRADFDLEKSDLGFGLQQDTSILSLFSLLPIFYHHARGQCEYKNGMRFLLSEEERKQEIVDQYYTPCTKENSWRELYNGFCKNFQEKLKDHQRFTSWLKPDQGRDFEILDEVRFFDGEASSDQIDDVAKPPQEDIAV